MKALYWNGTGALEWREQPEPTIRARTDALVRPIAVSTCDLDQVIIHADTPVPGSEQPFAIGHEGVGEVLEVGPGVRGVSPGDLAVISYHISCGTCDRCRQLRPLFCRASHDGAIATYGVPIGADYGGLFSDVVRVPFADHTLVRLPPSVSPVRAVSVGDNSRTRGARLRPTCASSPEQTC
jgi:threonine dehydrogenase-like Zn-dependent dehydrogenase